MSTSTAAVQARPYPVDVRVRCWRPRPTYGPDETWGDNWAVGVRVSVRFRIGKRTLKTRLADRRVIFSGAVAPTPEEARIEAWQIAEAGRDELAATLGCDLTLAPFERWDVDTSEWDDR